MIIKILGDNATALDNSGERYGIHAKTGGLYRDSHDTIVMPNERAAWHRRQ